MTGVRIQRVLRVGDSLAVTIPVEIAKALKIERGDQVSVAVYGEGIICVMKLGPEQLQAMKPPVVR